MIAASYIVGLIAATVMIVCIIGGFLETLKTDADSARLESGLRWHKVAFAAALVGLIAELFDLDWWSLADVGSVLCSGLSVWAISSRLASRREQELATAKRTARDYGLPWVGDRS